jgi:hypothetical protein
MNIVDIKKIQKLIGSEGGAAIVVDSLPTENIKPNVIYAVKKIDYYTSFYGLHISPLTSMSDVNTSVLADLMRQNGWKSGEITEALFGGILMMGLLPENLTKISNFEGHFINEYADNLFKLRTYIADAGVDFDKSFEKLDDLYQYLFSKEYAQSAGLFTQNFTNTQTKLREHNFVWSEQALPDYQLGVVFTPTYEYYIYNGEEWKNVDDQIVVKQINSLQGTITFTEEETLKLAQGAKLYALPYSYGSPIFIDCIEIGRQSEIKDGKANIWAYYKIGLAFDLDGTTYTEYLIKIITSSTGTKGSVYCQLGTRLKFWRDDISSDGWKEVTDVPGYKYGYFVEQWGVQAKSIVEVYFEIADAASGNFAPFVNTNPDSSISSGDYGFVIYAKEKPTGMMSFSYDVEF